MDKVKELLERLTWTYTILGIVAGAGYFYFQLDQTELDTLDAAIIEGQKQITTTQQKIAEAKEFERQFDEKKRKYADLVKELQKIQGALPKQILLYDLLSELLREAKKLEINVSSIVPDASESPGKDDLFSQLGFDIAWSGTFVQFFILLDRLSNLNRLVSVDSFDITPKIEEKVTLGGEKGMFATTNLTGGRTLYNKVSGKVRVITYRYKEKGGAPAAAPVPQKKKKSSEG